MAASPGGIFNIDTGGAAATIGIRVADTVWRSLGSAAQEFGSYENEARDPGWRFAVAIGGVGPNCFLRRAGEEVARLFAAAGFSSVRVDKDLAGSERVVSASFDKLRMNGSNG